MLKPLRSPPFQTPPSATVWLPELQETQTMQGKITLKHAKTQIRPFVIERNEKKGEKNLNALV